MASLTGYTRASNPCSRGKNMPDNSPGARLAGGGDVKILAALMLFIPSHSLPLFGFVLSIALLISISLLVTARFFSRSTGTGLTGFDTGGAVPMGIPIALAGLVHLIVLAMT